MRGMPPLEVLNKQDKLEYLECHHFYFRRYKCFCFSQKLSMNFATDYNARAPSCIQPIFLKIFPVGQQMTAGKTKHTSTSPNQSMNDGEIGTAP